MDYQGPERRRTICDRRDQECVFHEAHEVKFDNQEKKNIHICGLLNTLKVAVDTKVPMKLFYSTASGVIILILSILAVQWGTYQKVNDMALDHIEAMGDINSEIKEIKGEVRHSNELNVQARTAVKVALDESTKDTFEKIDNISKTIEKLHNGN